MKIKWLLFSFLCIFIFPFTCKAVCDDARISDLSKIASNVKFNYSYNVVDNYPIFVVDISNLTSDIYVIDSLNNTFSYNNLTSMNYQFQNKVLFSIYSTDPNCYDEKILDRTVSFPIFNKYSLYSQCDDYKNIDICQMWSNVGISNDLDFYTRIEKYKASLISNLDDETLDESFDLFDYLPIGYVLIFVVLLTIVVFAVRRKYNVEK